MHPSRPQTEEMLTIAPVPRGAIERAAARVPWNVPSRWTASMRRHSSSGRRTRASSGVVDRARRGLLELLRARGRRSARACATAAIPALLTQTSTGPSASSARRARRRPRRVATSARDGGPADARRSQLRRLAGDVEHGDARPVGGEPHADRLADARAAAGDDCDPALERVTDDHGPADDLAFA